MNRIRYLLISAVLAITSVISTQKSFAQQKFWLDGRMVEAQASTSGQATIDISTLSSGLHWFTITTKDEAGVWSAPMTKTFIVPYKSADGKSIVEHQYWIDGKMEASIKQNEQPSAIDVNTLAPGIHTLTIRVKDNTGLWSSQITKKFIVPVNQLDVADKKIVEHQYWIDGKMEASIKQNEQPSAIDVNTLAPGIHTLTIRVKDNTGLWSSQITKNFIVPVNQLDVEDKKIVEHQYWIDDKMEASVTQNEQPSTIDIATLTPGMHSLNVRVKDNTGMWSSQLTRYFVLDGDAMKETTITHCMYWFDDDLANAKTMMLDAETGTASIDISEVEAGTHTLWWRCGDSNGALSVPCSVSFESSSYYNYTVPESGIGTYSAKYNITLPDGLKAYFCTKPEAGADGLVFNLLKVDGNIINGNTGVLLCGTPGESYRMYPTEEEGAATEGNSLVAVTESADIAGVEGDYINYILQNWQFDKIADNATMPANSAYLSLPAAEVGDASTILVNDPEKITQDEDGYYLIGTARHWIDFAKIVETNESANAKMIADVDLGDSQVHIGPQDNTAYKGIFDGQGHTLTVAYVGKSNEVVAPFTRVQGATIKNIHVAGSIKSVFAYIGVVGIVVGPGKTTISNVWNSATMEINSGSWVQSGAILGGFKSSGDVEISDCLFTGTFTSSYGYYSGCFVGYNYESGSISVNNCLSTGTFNMSGPQFHGNYTNCYVTSFPASYPSGVQKPTNEELNNGTIATSLQADRVEEIWIQDPVLGVPRLKSFDKGISYTVPSSGIGTFSAKGHIMLPEGLKAYYCKAYDQQENTIGLVAISGNIVPAETGVVLVGNSGETFTLTGTCGETPEITNNELVAVTDSRHVNATDGDYTNFMMKGGKFVRIKESTNSMMPANRAYLPLSTALITDSNAKMITLRWDDETTGIKTTGDNDRMRNGVIYNLNGQKLSAPRKGINIINGRKVIVK